MRAQSTSPFHLLLLKVFHIKAHQEATEVKSFVDNLSTLMIFRFLTKLNVSTKFEADELICWADQKKVSLVQLQKCGKYFDVKQRKILVNLFPSKIRLSFLGVVGLLFLLTLSFCIWFAAYNKSIVKFNESGTWVALDQTSAHQIKLLENNLLLAKAGSACINSYAGDKIEALSSNEVTELCKFLSGQEVAGQINNAVLQQRIFAAYYGALSLIMAVLFLFIPIGQWTAAKKFVDVVNNNKP